MNPETFFIIKFTITNILFSVIVFLVLLSMRRAEDDNSSGSVPELLVFSLGIGPALTVLLLYIFMLVLPGRTHYFYFGAVWVVYAGFAILGSRQIPRLIREISSIARQLFVSFCRDNRAGKLRRVLVSLLLTTALAGVAVFFFNHVRKAPIEGHDILIYGNIGKYYFQEKKVAYHDFIYNPENGFFFNASPKPAFSLLLTWELLLNECFPGYSVGETARLRPLDFDFYFRSVSGYYTFLLVAIILLVLKKSDSGIAAVGLIVMAASLQFMLMLVSHHLDSFRIYFLAVALLLLPRVIRHKTSFNLLLLGMFAGFTAFVHLIGAAGALLIVASFFLFSSGRFRERFTGVLILSLYILLFGGAHYFLEFFFGARFGFHTYL